jgi:lysophospholipase L1-like esterase
MMQCSEGDICVISGTGGSGARLWGFVGNDGSILFVSAANITESSLILSAPANAAWIIINTSGNEASYKNILLSNLLSQLRSSTEKVTGSYLVDFVYGAYINTNVSVGSTVNLTRTNSKIFRSAIVDCVAGDIFCIDATGGTNPKTIAFVDSENKLIYNNGSAMQNRIVIAPTDSAKAIINDNTSGWTGKCYHGYLPELLSKIKHDIEQIKLITGTEITATGNDDEAVLVLSAPTEAEKDYYIGIKELNTTGVSDNKNILFVQDKNNSETLLAVKKNSIPQNFKFTAINDTSRIIIRAAQGTIAKLIFGGYTVQNLSTDEVTLSNLAEIMYGEPITNIGNGDTVVDLLSANTIVGYEYQIEVVSIDDTGVSDNKAILYVQNKNYTTVLASIIKGSQQRELSFVAEDNISRIRARATQGTTIKIKYNGLAKRTSGLESNVAKINQQINLDEVDKLPATSDILQPLFSTSFARIITDWGFVGASYDSGYFEDYSTTPMTGVTDYTKSWGQIFCGINNVQGYNFSRGGQTSKGWCTEQSERAWYGAQDNPKKGYTIQLGGNDLTSYDDGNPNAYPLGDPQTDIDFSDYNNNANTYCGWIAGVIQRIKSIAPKAPIFMLSINNRLSQEHDVVGWNEALKVVISRCNTELGKVYYVNQFGYPDWTNEEIARRYLVGGHPDFAGYVYLAGMFNRLIDNAIRNHIYAFKTIQFD